MYRSGHGSLNSRLHVQGIAMLFLVMFVKRRWLWLTRFHNLPGHPVFSPKGLPMTRFLFNDFAPMISEALADAIQACAEARPRRFFCSPQLRRTGGRSYGHIWPWVKTVLDPILVGR